MDGLQAEAAFDSAHFLADYFGKCENLHGHRWRVVATVERPELLDGTEPHPDGSAGDGTMRDMVLDFGMLKRALRDIADSLDHTFLVERGTLKPATIEALEGEGFALTVLPFRTTAENLARHIFGLLERQGFPVSQVEVDETPNNRAFYAPDGHVGR